MAKQTSSRSTGAAAKRKTSEAPAPITQVIAKPAKQAASPLTAKPALPSHDAIAQRAYELYRTRNEGEGSDLHDWLRAENDLRA